MRKYIQIQLLNAFRTFENALNKVEQEIFGKRWNNVATLLTALQESVIEVGNFIEEKEFDERDKLIQNMEMCCELIYKCAIEQKWNIKQLLCQKIKESIWAWENTILSVSNVEPIKILFVPYKAEMWSCMHTLWECAMDRQWNVQVVVSPYYSCEVGVKVFHYEAERFPDALNVIHYSEYDLQSEHPEVIIFHNPYDDSNNITQLYEEFFTSNLRNNTELLIYSPYFTAGVCVPGRSDFMFEAPGTYYADVILAQSEKAGKIFEQYDHQDQTILTFGSPKVDYIARTKTNEINIPQEWKEKINGKKVFLLNTHLSYFPEASQNKKASGNYAERFHKEIEKAFLGRDDCVLIWRPHPLLKTMINNRFPQCKEYIEHFERTVRQADNGIVDEYADYMKAFSVSDGLISTWSSLINEYMITQKPILIFQSRIKDEYKENVLLDRNVNYFRFGKDSMTFEEYRDMVVRGEDELKCMRLEAVKEAFPNVECSASQKIGDYIEKEFALCGTIST